MFDTTSGEVFMNLRACMFFMIAVVGGAIGIVWQSGGSSVTGFLQGVVATIAMLIVIKVILHLIPTWPICRTAGCGRRQYEVIKVKGREVHLQCRKCGNEYLKRDRHFYFLNRNLPEPYLKYRPLFGWKPEEGEEKSPSNKQ